MPQRSRKPEKPSTPRRVLLSCVGSRDPFASGPGPRAGADGPVLALLAARSDFDKVILFHTPDRSEPAGQTAAIARERHLIEAETRVLEIEDPTDHGEILGALRPHLRELSRTDGLCEFFISLSSGTSQMHACWLLLAAAGEIPAIVLQIREGRFVSRTLPLISEINPRSKAMPQILPNLAMQEIPETSPAEMKQALADSGIVGEHPALQAALQTAARAARYDLPVLLLGESGTGKELFARFIHRISRRRERSFLAVNCGSLPETLIESELFGHTKGSFTGAVANKKGHFELAEGGTLFLDEIGDAPILMQVKLLRALETQEITPLGGAKPLRTDARIVAATNRDLQSLIAEGRFREDLYHRLAAIRIALPQLNERRSDIPLIALCQLHRFNVECGTRKQLTQRALQSLQRHDWRGGNIRALRNVVHSSAVMSGADAIDSADLMLPRTWAECEGTAGIEIGDGFSLDDYLNGVRRQCYRQALDQAGSNRSEAARRLGISAQAVHNFLKEYPDLLSKLNRRQ